MTEEESKRFDAKTDEEIAADAASDPDAAPVKLRAGTTKAKRVSFARHVRLKLAMTRESGAMAYGIPLDILKVWESHQAHPSPVEEAYLKLIDREPELAKVAMPVAAK